MKLAPWNDPTVKWVCENHPEKEWEVECSCGAGMPEPTPENYQKGYITKSNMNPIDTHLIKDTKRTKQREYCSECNRVTGTDYMTGKCGGCIMQLVIKDTRKRTAKKNQLHPITKLAILSGAIALLAVLYYMSVVTDAIIGLILI